LLAYSFEFWFEYLCFPSKIHRIWYQSFGFSLAWCVPPLSEFIPTQNFKHIPSLNPNTNREQDEF